MLHEECPIDCGDHFCICTSKKDGMRSNKGCTCSEQDLQKAVHYWKQRCLRDEEILNRFSETFSDTVKNLYEWLNNSQPIFSTTPHEPTEPSK